MMTMKAKNVLKDKAENLGKKFSVALETERRASEMLLDCYDKGLINNKLSEKAIHNLKAVKKLVMTHPQMQLLHSKDGTSGKMRKLMLASGDHKFPLQQQQDTSRKINEKMLELDVALRILKERNGIDVPHAYSLTLTVPNVHKGQLEQRFGSWSKLSKDAKKRNLRYTNSRLKKEFNKGVDPNHRSHFGLVGGTYLGGMYAFELTVNDKNLEAGKGKSIYHPHVHWIIFSDTVLDEKATADAIFDKWQSINPHVKLSRAAFDFEHVYKKQASTKAKNKTDKELENDLKTMAKDQLKQTIISGIKEATMYTMKPQSWDALYKKPEEFAEVYNALHGAKAKNNVGVMYEASTFLRVFEEFMNGFGMSTMTEFPDIVTQLSKLDFKHNKDMNYHTNGMFSGGYIMKHDRELTPDEVIFYNRSILEHCLVDENTESKIEKFLDCFSSNIPDKKMKIYAKVFESYTFARNFDELQDRLQKFANEQDGVAVLSDQLLARAKNKKEQKNLELRIKKAEAKAYDIRLLADSLSALYDPIKETLVVDSSNHTRYLKDLFQSYKTLYKKHMGTLDGFSEFASKQGLPDPSSPFSVVADTTPINLFVDIPEIENYLGSRFFENWADVKKKIISPQPALSEDVRQYPLAPLYASIDRAGKEQDQIQSDMLDRLAGKFDAYKRLEELRELKAISRPGEVIGLDKKDLEDYEELQKSILYAGQTQVRLQQELIEKTTTEHSVLRLTINDNPFADSYEKLIPMLS